MSSVEIRLRALANALDVPVEPDLTGSVLAQLEGRHPFAWRRAAVLAFALVAIAVGAAFAVPQARTAILRFFHIGGETLIRVETLPRAVERSQANGLGRPLSLQDAERRLGFRLALPRFKGASPRRVYVIGTAIGTVIVRWHGRSVLLSEFTSLGGSGLKKLAANATIIEPVEVNGRAGLWLEGGPHTLTYFDRATGYQEQPILIRGNVLLWLRDGLTLRLEGELSRADAITLAQTVR